ncbi:MAG: DDE-type integrase/transposase/recombinase [Rhodospirillales bacterium]
MGDLLRRRGLSEQRRGPRRALVQTRPFAEAQTPHDLWCIDFKGWFRTLDGQRCDPLTVSDAVSRYLLCCSIAAQTTEGVWPIFDRLFSEHGQPAALRMDNGTPFCSTGAAGLSRLSIRWLKLGIRLEPIVPGRPQQNGRHERDAPDPEGRNHAAGGGDACRATGAVRRGFGASSTRFVRTRRWGSARPPRCMSAGVGLTRGGWRIPGMTPTIRWRVC